MGQYGNLMNQYFNETGERLKGFDTDRSFMVVEIAGDRLFFQVISRTGETIDSGELPRKMASQSH